MPTVNFAAIAPEIVVLCGASVVLMLDVFVSDARRHLSFWLTQIVLLAAIITIVPSRVNSASTKVSPRKSPRATQ